MWFRVAHEDMGLMSSLDSVICRSQWKGDRSYPDLSHSSNILVFSDYSGSHENSRCDCYSFLLIAQESWPLWEERRRQTREHFRLGDRTFAFKKLNDAMKQKALPSLLSAANDLNGLCVSIVIDKQIRTVICEDGSERAEFMSLFPTVSLKERSFERLMRVVHFVGFFVAGLVHAGQNIIWITDRDEIAAGPSQLAALTKVFGLSINRYVSARGQLMLGHLRCGTTESDVDNQLEDLAAIPDLVAGAMAEVLTSCQSRHGSIPVGLWSPMPDEASQKTSFISSWLSNGGHQLKRAVFSIGYSRDRAQIDVSCIDIRVPRLIH